MICVCLCMYRVLCFFCFRLQSSRSIRWFVCSCTYVCICMCVLCVCLSYTHTYTARTHAPARLCVCMHMCVHLMLHVLPASESVLTFYSYNHHIHTHIHAYTYACIHTYTHIYICVHTHTCIHTHMHTYTQLLSSRQRQLFRFLTRRFPYQWESFLAYIHTHAYTHTCIHTHSYYLQDNGNCFDFSLVVFPTMGELSTTFTNLIGLGDDYIYQMIAFRSMRVFRIVKLTKHLTGLKRLAIRAFGSPVGVFYSLLVTIIFIFFYSLFGNQIFKDSMDFAMRRNDYQV